MKQVYSTIYTSLYDEYDTTIPLEKDLITLIKNSIDQNENGSELRPDAKYFLLVNFHHLVVKPLIDTKSPYSKQILPPLQINFFQAHRLNLENDIGSDIQTIINKSRQDGEIELKKEVSGHKIIQTINKVWKQLKTTKLEIWG